MSIKIRKSGMLTTVQDQGRIGYQKYGIVTSGAMDPLASRITNLLVGNQAGAAVLEMTLMGAEIAFQQDALIAFGGGDMPASIDDVPVHSYRSIYITKGSVLRFGNIKRGCRVYLAIAGGFDIPVVMDSYSTYLRAAIGGFDGRPLKKGDELSFGSFPIHAEKLFHELREQAHSDSTFQEVDWGISSKFLPALPKSPVVQAFKGRQYSWFTQESGDTFFSEPFEITPQSDRMGYRLQGPRLELAESKDLLSEAVTFGTIQVPSDGNPIILLADRQTTGGYAKIAQVATVDLPILAQLKPGDAIHFKEISYKESQALHMEMERELRKLQLSIHLKMKQEG